MSTPSYNPYAKYGPLFKNGLDYIIQYANPDLTIDDLNNLVLWYVLSTDPGYTGPIYSGGGSGIPAPPLGDTGLDNLINAITPNVANDYMNRKITWNSTGNVDQKRIISLIMKGINCNTVDSLNAFFDNVDQNIGILNNANSTKISLYLASAISRGSYTYWAQLLDGAAVSGWDNYIYSSYNVTTNRGNWAANYNNIPSFTTASLLGALSGYSQLNFPANPYPDAFYNIGISAGIFGSLIGSLALTAGKIIFKWPQNMELK